MMFYLALLVLVVVVGWLGFQLGRESHKIPTRDNTAVFIEALEIQRDIDGDVALSLANAVLDCRPFRDWPRVLKLAYNVRDQFAKKVQS